jgi:short subunit dehydrogenase-like uncharacterized protein
MRIAVYGASGYTGKLVVAELHRRGVEMVVAGRNRAKLESMVTDLGAAGAQVRTAGVDDPAGLAAVLEGCDGVVNCAGPFTFFGEQVVRAAITAGCHYVDTTGEQRYMQRIFERCHDDALRAKVAVIPAMGFDIVPGDVIAHLTAAGLEPLERLTIAYRTAGFGVTRGTMHSALEILSGGDLVYEGGAWSPAGPMGRAGSVVFPGESRPAPTLRFPGGEIVTVPRHVKTRRLEVVMDARSFVPGPLGSVTPATAPALGALLRTPARRLLDRFIDRLPEGPPEHKRRTASFTILAEAIGSDGRVARGEIRGTDVYGSTALLSVEGVSRLCAGAPAGVLAPSQAFELEDFTRFLGTIGYSWKVSELG